MILTVESDVGISHSASAEELDNSSRLTTRFRQSEDKRDYQIFQEKLRVEFNRNPAEWDKAKNIQNEERFSPNSSKDRDLVNSILMSNEQLTPEFKKKLQEWKRIKKGQSFPENQVFRKLADWQIWRTSAKSNGETKETSNDLRKYLL